MEEWNWSPLDQTDVFKFHLGKYALLILNRPILLPPQAMKAIWNNACFRVTVDGGTKVWLNYVMENRLEDELAKVYPEVVSGDFDSLPTPILDQCRDCGVHLEHTIDQNETDFTKALRVISSRSISKLESVLVIAENSGRLDHIYSNINTLGLVKDIFKSEEVRCYLLSVDCLSWLLREGKHRIEVPKRLVEEASPCGVLPFSASTVTTTGLKWNLCDNVIAFGGLISSSNTYDLNVGGLVTVQTTGNILWSMSLGAQ